MGYAEGKYQTRQFSKMSGALNVGTCTGTASGHAVTLSTAQGFPKFIRRTKLNGIRVEVKTAPVPTGVTLNFLNGTNTVGSVAVGTSTAGVFVDATMTAANQTFAANDICTISVVGTATASAAQAAGVYDIYFEEQEQFA